MIIRKARSRADMEAVWKLTHDEYVRMGYAQPQPDGMLKHYELDGLPETWVWLAEDELGGVVGTLSLTLDGPAGLHVDDDFKDVVDGLRTECDLKDQMLGAYWRIVSKTDYRGKLAVSMGLISTGVQAAVRLPVDVSLYTFNPRHERFYRRMLDLQTIAGPRAGHSVKGAPAILMRGDRDLMQSRWARISSRRNSARLTPVDTGEFRPV